MDTRAPSPLRILFCAWGHCSTRWNCASSAIHRPEGTVKVILKISAAVIVAFVLTSAGMFWVDLLLPDDSGVWVTDSITPEYIDTYTPSSDAIKKDATVEERGKLDVMHEELRGKDDSTLLKFKAFEDAICTNGLLDCDGLASSKVRPFIDAILADRAVARDKANEDTARSAMHNSHIANIISGASLFFAILSLGIASMSYLRKRQPAD
jgi:hypothetical protein